MEDPGLAEVAQDICGHPDPLGKGNLEWSPQDAMKVSDSLTHLRELEHLRDHGSSSTASSVPTRQTKSQTEEDCQSSCCKATTVLSADKGKAKLVLCEVCRSPSEGYCYFRTIVTCSSCRAFFNRSVKNNAHALYVCVNVSCDKQCSIDSGSWRSCKKCRFDRCLQVGMGVKDKKEEDFKMWQIAIQEENLRKALTLSDKLSIDEKFFLQEIILKRIKVKKERRTMFLTHD